MARVFTGYYQNVLALSIRAARFGVMLHSAGINVTATITTTAIKISYFSFLIIKSDYIKKDLNFRSGLYYLYLLTINK
ncbi:hypothetical protein AANUM_1488 [Aggregatibacter actinomycetemcomitans NUM4039]|nr:hypothetical protein AANUM_1488 [Aggregatibacter actinomycetemcomitans NUM4039]